MNVFELPVGTKLRFTYLSSLNPGLDEDESYVGQTFSGYVKFPASDLAKNLGFRTIQLTGNYKDVLSHDAIGQFALHQSEITNGNCVIEILGGVDS